MKIFSRKFPCNPLICLDYDDRIQGNPSFSNPLGARLSQREGERPRKPRIAGASEAARPGAQSTIGITVDITVTVYLLPNRQLTSPSQAIVKSERRGDAS